MSIRISCHVRAILELPKTGSTKDEHEYLSASGIHLEPALVLGIDAPELFAGSVRLEMPIAAAGKPGPIKRQSLRDQGGRQIRPVREEAFRDDALVGQAFGQDRPDGLTLAQGDHGELRLLAIGLIQFRRVDAGQPDVGAGDDDRVAIDDMAAALQNLAGPELRQGRPRPAGFGSRQRRCGERAARARGS